MRHLANPRTWLALLSLGLVLWLVVRDVEKVAPGPLHPSHAALDDLRGVAHCDACHGGRERELAQGCLDCHAAIGAQLERETGLHGGLAPDQRRACADCHAEHHDAELPLVGARAFQLAGFEDQHAYDHSGLQYGLLGRHAELACEACHELANAPSLAAGQTRFLGLTQACEDCHPDSHEGAMSADCESCHGQSQPFPEVAAFEHDPLFPLAGAHAGHACARCHEPGSTRSIEASRQGTGRAARGCADCHAAPHAPDLLAAFGRAADGVGCASCHAAQTGGFARGPSTLSVATHALTGFPLDAPHAGLECAACHGAPDDAWIERFPGREAGDCRACHDDPHAGQFAARSCAECHGADGFTPALFDHAAHAAAGFALQGVHADVACGDCHAPGAPTRFAGTPGACVDCHEDVHRGFFDAGAMLADGRTDCAACHSSAGFGALLADAFDHGQSTGFALADAHAEAACEACHVQDDPARVAGRRLGFLADRLTVDPGRCAGCHADPHDGHVAASEDCARCHGTRAFAQVAEFDHGAATGFALSGAHASGACETCHGTGAGRRLGRAATSYPGPRDRCATCHVDPHDGLFDAAGDCAACHVDTSFALADIAAFDHGASTGYALQGTHASASCDACHAPLAAPDFLGRRSARACGTGCADCHADPHLGQFALAGATDCVRCHTQSAFTELAFDHDRDSRFVLDATHAVLACSACHKAHQTAGGARAIRYRPLGTDCVDCHGTPGGKGGGQ
jgi:hypothetical protein